MLLLVWCSSAFLRNSSPTTRRTPFTRSGRTPPLTRPFTLPLKHLMPFFPKMRPTPFCKESLVRPLFVWLRAWLLGLEAFSPATAPVNVASLCNNAAASPLTPPLTQPLRRRTPLMGEGGGDGLANLMRLSAPILTSSPDRLRTWPACSRLRRCAASCGALRRVARTGRWAVSGGRSLWGVWPTWPPGPNPPIRRSPS